MPDVGNPKLQAYRAKRDFTASPEPRGAGRAAGQTIFVVHKHAARRLHYDFRLQIGSVLVSWAVPKEPSMDPQVKRLAVKVEDHPLDYADFFGDIPAGQYGAGHVDIWDRGHWSMQGNPAQALQRGHLHFRLQGRRLQGDWALIRTRDEQWLLRKVQDVPPKPAARTLPGKAASMPRQLKPPLATLADQPPVGEDWRYEVKYDGYRMLCELRDGNVRFISRNGLDWTARMQPLATTIRALKLGQGWLDGEVVVFNEQGIADFQLLQKALDGDASCLRYVVFDLPYWEGRDLRGIPLSQRQHWLSVLLERAPSPLRLTQRLDIADAAQAAHAWLQACQLQLEGLIALVQWGVIELHTWNSRAPKTETPDRLILDLDPGDGVDWPTIVEAAQLVRGLMQEVGLVPFLKSTGGKGLHLVAPLKPVAGWQEVKALAHGLADRLESVLPDRFVANMAKAKRGGRIFVDYLRNGKAATAVAAFSVRGRPGGPVAMPLPWDVLDPARDLRTNCFNVRNALEWIETHPHPWADYAASRRQVGPRMLARLGLRV
ncbi:ATP-dependent DNA ligase domain protein [Bordetella holmesii CDC-H643-BH]|nr:DNA polymerase ligase N-terminal domain-containing protein [Bordetella holmesii]AMD50485.1 hypothetical protein F783_002625 [Bordetella holmesii F627]KAK82839.1 ATP-dependent DNA ligase domain protein [Bordetella holmesii H620]KCV07142.1 ATP-dependent DNA ligase domain protein [Bordetella holmesii CDC-H629-BH]KCV17186.1 ATP-dependent DNA ligase domain protein [Bordetella holmesii CDC-H643-BH]